MTSSFNKLYDSSFSNAITISPYIFVTIQDSSAPAELLHFFTLHMQTD